MHWEMDEMNHPSRLFCVLLSKCYGEGWIAWFLHWFSTCTWFGLLPHFWTGFLCISWIFHYFSERFFANSSLRKNLSANSCESTPLVSLSATGFFVSNTIFSDAIVIGHHCSDLIGFRQFSGATHLGFFSQPIRLWPRIVPFENKFQSNNF